MILAHESGKNGKLREKIVHQEKITEIVKIVLRTNINEAGSQVGIYGYDINHLFFGKSNMVLKSGSRYSFSIPNIGFFIGDLYD